VSVITPTHQCFDDALEYLELRVKARPALALGRTLRLVHGILLCPAETDGTLAPGTPFAHAWIEEEDADHEVRVLQSGVLNGERIMFSVPRADFREAMRPQAETAYTCRDVVREHDRTGHSGPWRAEYRALCRGGK
jgi:hypothetical protein